MSRHLSAVVSHQRRALEAIDNLTASLGYPPSMREVAEAIGLKSVGQTHNILSALKDASYVAWEPRMYRTLRLTERGRQALL